MSWVLVIGVVWLVLAVLLALLIGRSVHLADLREGLAAGADEPNFVVDRPAVEPTPRPTGPPTTAAGSPTPSPGPASRDPSTIPGIPAARPSAARPGVPAPKRGPSRRASDGRKSQSG